jgi:hypothetical protein
VGVAGAAGDPWLASSERQNVGEEAVDLDEQRKNEAGKQDKGHWSRGEKLGEIRHTYLSSWMGEAKPKAEEKPLLQRGEMGTASSGS